MYQLAPIHWLLDAEYWINVACEAILFLIYLPWSKMLVSFQFINNNSPLGYRLILGLHLNYPNYCIWLFLRCLKIQFYQFAFAFVRTLICKCDAFEYVKTKTMNQINEHMLLHLNESAALLKELHIYGIISDRNSRRNKFKSRKTQQCVISINLKESITFVHISLFSVSLLYTVLVLAYSIHVLNSFRRWFGLVFRYSSCLECPFSFNIKLLRISAAFDIFSFGV